MVTSPSPQEAQKRIHLADTQGVNALGLRQLGLSDLPPELWALTGLESLDLFCNRLENLPSEIRRLTKLKVLDLNGNRLSVLPLEATELTEISRLDLSANNLTRLPPEIGRMTNLRELYLSVNQLTELPPEIGQLRSLKTLFVSANGLTKLPAEIGDLANLETLYLSHNKLTELPRDIGKLQNLTCLKLHENRLTVLPPEFGHLIKLEELDVEGNDLRWLPPEIGSLSGLRTLTLSRNNLLTEPPPEIVQRGISAILTYLRARMGESCAQWVSKLLLVGEGGVGKTSLVRALKNEPFDPQEPTTHGIRVGPVALQHPGYAEVTMQLNTWDFGGQQIYHATHQFFLTARSLYLLVWNARMGFEQCKLYYWLDSIQARAPESPVLLVATCLDQRDADLPLADLRRKYPQIVGSYEISNLNGRGIEELRKRISAEAARLPLMGEKWPATWLRAAEQIRTWGQNTASPNQLRNVMSSQGIPRLDQDVLATWLHELGDIVFFQDDPELNDLVLLRPDWVSSTISTVLDSAEVRGNSGIFTRRHMESIWSDLEPSLRDHFLRLMEKFDLSYRTLDNRDISIVVECLSLNPPAYEALWKGVPPGDGSREVSMKFQFGSTIPAGLPTWLIARSHRFTTRTHWRLGALFSDGPDHTHLALVEAFPHDRYIRLTVRGPYPQNFFGLLRDGLELTIARFPGLKVERKVPCPGHDGTPCCHEFDYAHLLKAIERDPPVLEVSCPESFQSVSIPKLFFGIQWSSQHQILARIAKLDEKAAERHDEIRGEFKELREWTQREFLKLFRVEQSKLESHCPNVFTLTSESLGSMLQTLEGLHGRTFWAEWQEKIAGVNLLLQLWCQMPGAWHPSESKGYDVQLPAPWLEASAPYLKRLAAVLKHAVPYVGPVLGVAAEGIEQRAKAAIKLMEQLANSLPGDERAIRAEEDKPGGDLTIERLVEGAQLRNLRQLLDQLDPNQHWGGLRKVLTPEGHYMWLCAEHAKQFLL
jgi:GTPase SAR1 family protein